MSKKKKVIIHKFHSMDYALVITTLVLSLFGIVMAFSASYYYSISKFDSPYRLLMSNIMWFVLGWIVLLFLSRIDYHFLRNFSLLGMEVGFALLVLLLVLRNTPLTSTINNATRWFKIGPITLMPSEIFKAALILFFASWFSAQPDTLKKGKNALYAFAVLVVAAVLIYLQPNLSTAMIVVAIGFVMMLIAGLPLGWLGGAAGAGALIIGYLYFIDDGYMHTRLMTALDPWADPIGDGYQVVQGLLALGSGGLKGVGLGRSIQKTLYLPEPQSDFILPIIGEELGLIGIIILLILYAILIGRIISIALRAKDTFGCYLAAGTGALLAIHVILNILVVTASFPPTGVFLPFMSQGGNATLVILALIGIVLNVSRQADDVPEEEEEL